MNDGELKLVITSRDAGSGTSSAQSRTLQGWMNVRLTRGVERVPNDFMVSMTELYPGQAQSLTVQPGDKCTAYIGDDVVLTGYVDRVAYTITPEGHSVSIAGRGLCQDLVDCSAEWDGGQISGTSALDIATKLAKPYGIVVNCDIGALDAIPQFNIGFTETPWDIIDRVCKNQALLAYENADGSLQLTRIGTETQASIIKEGVNVQEATATMDMSQQYSEYKGYLTSVETAKDLGLGGQLQQDLTDPNPIRHRIKSLVAESVGGTASQTLLKNRVAWEMTRRDGRSRSVTVLVDGWRDGGGTLWQPNYQIDFVSPSLKINTQQEGKPFVIGEVTYFRQEGTGTTALLRLMPASAYSPQPTLLQPDFPDVPFTTALPAT